MKINIDTGYRGRNQDEERDPYAKVIIDVSPSELKEIQKHDADLYFFLTRLLKKALTEADKGVQVF